MSKINILEIVLAHYRSVFDGGVFQFAKDALIFFCLPLACAAVFFVSVGNISDELRNLFVTVFSIFSALLFSAQIGLFALKRAGNYDHLGDIERAAREKMDSDFNKFLKSFSANTSYLILLSAAALVLFVIEYILDPNSNSIGCKRLIDAVIIFLSMHFFLTLMMVLKRFFVAYEGSY